MNQIEQIKNKIERLIDKEKHRYYEEYDCAYRDGNNAVCHTLLSFIESLAQEQTTIFSDTVKQFYGEELSTDDTRYKAALYFYGEGRGSAYRETSKEAEKHTEALIENYKNGMKAGYDKALAELKEGKIECSPVMQEFVNKLFDINNKYNCGFGPELPIESIEQESRDTIKKE